MDRNTGVEMAAPALHRRTLHRDDVGGRCREASLILAQRGLCKALGKPVDGWKSAGAAEAYRCVLHDTGREVLDARKAVVVRRGVSAEKVREALAERGKLSLGELVRLRVRYFTDGLALGSREFVQEVFGANRGQFSPKRQRQDGAQRISESETELYAMRRLRTRAVG